MMTPEEFREYMKIPDKEEFKGMTKCKICEVILDFEITGLQQITEGYLCDDCYFESMGEEIEKHPIISPEMISKRLI